MKNNQFAVLGATAKFLEPRPVGQLYFPSWERYEAAMRGIFERRYYTNQGPAAQNLEKILQQHLNVKHAICVTNGTIGLMMAAEALELTGKVILPSFTFVASAQSLSWAGIEPVFCDVDPNTFQIDIDHLDSLIDDDVSAIMGVNLWGGACDPKKLESYAASRGLKVYFDSAQAFGCEVDGKKIGGFGELEVFSFHATKIISGTEGGCITTNNDEIAARLRNIRSGYGAGEVVEVVKTSNGRMSEAQAAIASMSLSDFSINQRNNESLFRKYQSGLANIPGISLVEPKGVSASNYQYGVCQIDELKFGMTRDLLITVLEAENIIARRYFYPGVHRTVQYKSLSDNRIPLPVTDMLCNTSLQLPLGAMVDADDVGEICNLISNIQYSASELTAELQAKSKCA